LPADSDFSNPHSNREHIRSAREAAEALFRPKEALRTAADQATAPVQHVSSIPESGPVHKPRILAALQAKVPDSQPEPSAPSGSPEKAKAPRRKRVPIPQHARVRMLLTYGMTLEQVAELYGVTVEAISNVMSRRSDL
jgi:hypothetical protein